MRAGVGGLAAKAVADFSVGHLSGAHFFTRTAGQAVVDVLGQGV